MVTHRSMSRNQETWRLISSLLQTVVDEAEAKAEEREKGLPSYKTGQLGTNLELLKTVTALMRQVILLQGVEDLIQVSYYTDKSKTESSKQVEQVLNKVILQMISAISSNY